MMGRSLAFLLAAVFGLATTAVAGELRLGLAVEPDSIDPHYHNFGGNKGLIPNLFEALTAMDPRDRLTPGLAIAWRLIDDATWEFKLRPGVTFSDGTTLTADDVAFTIERVPKVPTTVTDMAEYVKAIARTEVIDPHTVRFHTKGPFPLAPEYLSAIGIVSRQHGEGASTSDYNTGKAAIGTGPFRFVSWARGDRMVLARNETWWGDQHRLGQRDDPLHQESAVAAGGAARRRCRSDRPAFRCRTSRGCKGDARFTVASGLSDDIVGFVFDQQDRAVAEDHRQRRHSRCATNPFHDRRVREAVDLAIDRAAIRDRIMNGQSDPDNQYMKPGQYGYDPGCRRFASIRSRRSGCWRRPAIRTGSA